MKGFTIFVVASIILSFFIPGYGAGVWDGFWMIPHGIVRLFGANSVLFQEGQPGGYNFGFVVGMLGFVSTTGSILRAMRR